MPFNCNRNDRSAIDFLGSQLPLLPKTLPILIHFFYQYLLPQLVSPSSFLILYLKKIRKIQLFMELLRMENYIEFIFSDAFRKPSLIPSILSVKDFVFQSHDFQFTFKLKPRFFRSLCARLRIRYLNGQSVEYNRMQSIFTIDHIQIWILSR